MPPLDAARALYDAVPLADRGVVAARRVVPVLLAKDGANAWLVKAAFGVRDWCSASSWFGRPAVVKVMLGHSGAIRSGQHSMGEWIHPVPGWSDSQLRASMCKMCSGPSSVYFQYFVSLADASFNGASAGSICIPSASKERAGKARHKVVVTSLSGALLSQVAGHRGKHTHAHAHANTHPHSHACTSGGPIDCRLKLALRLTERNRRCHSFPRPR